MTDIDDDAGTITDVYTVTVPLVQDEDGALRVPPLPPMPGPHVVGRPARPVKEGPAA